MMWLRDLWGTFRSVNVADVIDVAIIACLLYLVLLWFKRTKAAFVARGILIFVAIYVLARQSGMYLTTWVFQGFFAVFLIALVVIFQEELRSFFERLAVWSLRRSVHPLLPREVETLVRTAGHLSRNRIGALMVLRGRDPLERHIEGGEDLDGALSGPLLESLFDPHSTGHDGALIIDQNRVLQFGTHLPLSKDFDQLSGMGTRHAAALGLAERTDALCLVVSEERGTISVACGGQLLPVEDLDELQERIMRFLKVKAPITTEMRWWRDALRRNATEKGLALATAVCLWLVFVQGYSPSNESLRLPVQVEGVAEGLRVAAIRPRRVAVTVKGLRRDLKLLNTQSLAVRLSVSGLAAGTARMAVSEDHLRLPGTIQLARIDPAIVELELAPVQGMAGEEEGGKPLISFFGLDFGTTKDKPPLPTVPKQAPAHAAD